MKNVYFVQVDVSATLGAQSTYLPYTAGILAASAWTGKIVQESYCFKGFIFLREDIPTQIQRMENPSIVLFSNYCWNTEYHKYLASAVKEKWPACTIVFGGHNVPDNFSFLEEFPYIDILCHGEGEDTVKHLMETLATDGSLNDVCNISFRNSDGSFVRTETRYQTTLDYPSPYLQGWFDTLIAEHPDISFNAILETSRGCPNQCAYCDWGLLRSKVRLFPFDRIKAEIQWFSDHKIAFLWGADGNFGMFKRDLDIADELVKAKKATGFPERMRMNYAKNNFENVFQIIKKFTEGDFDRVGATLSFQSLSPTVLNHIGRTNADIEFYQNLLSRYNAEKMKAYSELILGLPGETYESFIAGLGKIFEIGQHFVFEVYGCNLLPNSLLGQKSMIEKFGIQSVRSEEVRYHVESSSFNIPEFRTLVVGTNTMSTEMWVRSLLFSYVVKSFHGTGLLRAFAIYIHCIKGIKYEHFYDGLLTYCQENPNLFLSQFLSEIRSRVEEQSQGNTCRKMIFEKAGQITWDFDEYITLTLLSNLDRFYADIEPYLARYQIDADVFEDLLHYQKSILRLPESSEIKLHLRYDVHQFLSDVYVNNIHPLAKRDHICVMRDSKVMPDWKSFAKFVVWYGRMGWASYKDDIQIIDR